MKNIVKALPFIATGALVLALGIFVPPQPRAGWWCTAFSIMCGEAVEDDNAAEKQEVEFRWRLADWLRELEGKYGVLQNPLTPEDNKSLSEPK